MFQRRKHGFGGDPQAGRGRYSLVVVVVVAAAAANCTGCGGDSKPKKDMSRISGDATPQRDSDLRSNVPSGRAQTSADDRRNSSPFVVRLERDLDMHETAARALGRIGAPAVPELRRALADVDPGVRIQAAEVLARIGPEAESAVPDLIVALEDESEQVRKAAARALGQIGPAAAPAVPALIRSMRESDERLPPARPKGQ